MEGMNVEGGRAAAVCAFLTPPSLTALPQCPDLDDLTLQASTKLRLGLAIILTEDDANRHLNGDDASDLIPSSGLLHGDTRLSTGDKLWTRWPLSIHCLPNGMRYA
ncbi:hypothetical protein P152DRAFT_73956 [Eremomyces bilateralis CBS 781.70]|uniref:Uncharacterized protein n=1 Tax=Eremomyces bilateralis CBS 781.70 TaxID=1392243 RepID=A0A6G1FZB1_9PEZI|nr:uncharacterized protein P152DRAFT_73956 [Eremomyces bilateralis CBS 781.70]KAF1811010.1 hypothetical protein P152DRAFT_73956 [Eremomyces bilateralis CBS 781.70]